MLSTKGRKKESSHAGFCTANITGEKITIATKSREIVNRIYPICTGWGLIGSIHGSWNAQSSSSKQHPHSALYPLNNPDFVHCTLNGKSFDLTFFIWGGKRSSFWRGRRIKEEGWRKRPPFLDHRAPLSSTAIFWERGHPPAPPATRRRRQQTPARSFPHN